MKTNERGRIRHEVIAIRLNNNIPVGISISNRIGSQNAWVSNEMKIFNLSLTGWRMITLHWGFWTGNAVAK